MRNTDIIFVLGAMRSGTSALTRVLSLCGFSLPSVVFAPNAMNPKGFWEPTEATRLNINFMSRRQSMLGDPSFRLSDELIDGNEREAFITEIVTFLKQCRPRTPLIVKELSISALMQYWAEAARRAGYTVKIVIAVRHPTESVTSATDQATISAAIKDTISSPIATSIELASASWLTMNLLSERNTRDFPRVFVHYENLLNNWREEASRIARRLSVEITPDETAISGFLTKDLRRHNFCGPVIDNFPYTWISRVYSFLCAAAADSGADAAPNVSELDEIYEAYRLAERTFRIALEKFREAFSHFETMHSRRLQAAPVWKSGLDY